jgi:hypothetical protein
MNKSELINSLEESREKFLDLLELLDEDDLLTPNAASDWSIKDLLVHLTMWEAQLITLIWQLKSGQKPTTIHFAGLSDDEINQKWYTENINRPLEFVLDDFYAVRDQTIRRVGEMSERDLTDPNRYPWLKGKTLWKIVAESSFEHEQEHIQALLAWVAKRRAQ